MLDARVTTFLTVCRTRNYTHAARELNLTQSAVSQHIAYLEKYYRTKLVTFEGKTMNLTEAGALLQHAYRSFAHDELLLERQIASASPEAAMRINIGMTLTAGEYLVAPPLARYLAKNPGVHVNIVSRSTKDLLDALARGSIDCAFLEGIFDRSERSCTALCTQELVCICAPDHPLAGKRVGFDKLLAETIILREPESGSRAVLSHALAQRNLTVEAFRHAMEASSINIIKSLVKAGIGISFVYEAAAKDDLSRNDLARIQLTGAPIVHDITFVRPAASLYEKRFGELFEGIKAEFDALWKQR